jgi:hypothetical protein
MGKEMQPSETLFRYINSRGYFNMTVDTRRLVCASEAVLFAIYLMELNEIWKEELVALFEVLSQHWPSGTEKEL